MISMTIDTTNMCSHLQSNGEGRDLRCVLFARSYPERCPNSIAHSFCSEVARVITLELRRLLPLCAGGKEK